ncbi:hypothetical protein KIPB_003301, partial [Kipferlia bialata]
SPFFSLSFLSACEDCLLKFVVIVSREPGFVL